MTDNMPQMTEATGSGLRLVQQSASSERRVDVWNDPSMSLKPATQDDFRRELTACLALVAPAGFDDTARSEWLRAAWATLNGIPADLLVRGCRVARRDCDHPSKVVPAVMREIQWAWDSRKRARIAAAGPETQAAPVECVSPDAVAAILSEFGLRHNPKAPLADTADAPDATLEPLRFLRSNVQPVELADHEVPNVDGMSIREIFEQRDRIRAQKLRNPANESADEVPEEYARFLP